MQKEIFINLAKLFNNNGFRLYMIGGTSRDYLLDIEFTDYDFCTDATPIEIKKFLPNATFTFEKYGSVQLKINGLHIDITTLRVEDSYIDSRHPSKVTFTKNIEEDYKRRDFTINAIYIDEKFNTIDFCNGLSDLKNKIIRFIGDPVTRVKEDPLRILRAERFQKKLGFEIEKNSLLAMNNNRELINKLNPQKVKQELKK